MTRMAQMRQKCLILHLGHPCHLWIGFRHPKLFPGRLYFEYVIITVSRRDENSVCKEYLMRSSLPVLSALLLTALLATRALSDPPAGDADTTAVAADEQVLAKVKLPTDGPALLDY